MGCNVNPLISYFPYTLKPTSTHISILFAQDAINRYNGPLQNIVNTVTIDRCMLERSFKLQNLCACFKHVKILLSANMRAL